MVVDAAGKSVDVAASEQADIGFFAIDPVRGANIAFSAVGADHALAGFVERMKASGFVADALARHRVEGASVAPAR